MKTAKIEQPQFVKINARTIIAFFLTIIFQVLCFVNDSVANCIEPSTYRKITLVQESNDLRVVLRRVEKFSFKETKTVGSNTDKQVESYLFHGLIPTTRKSKNQLVVVRYDTLPNGLFPVEVGNVWKTGSTFEINGKEIGSGTTEITVGELTEVKIGECSYDVFQIFSDTNIEGRGQFLIVNLFSKECH